jgi:muconolactone delta-isomerase
MFHRMAIPQEADALHVEPVDAQHKEKKRKKRNQNQQSRWRHLWSGTRNVKQINSIHEDQKFNGPATISS